MGSIIVLDMKLFTIYIHYKNDFEVFGAYRIIMTTRCLHYNSDTLVRLCKINSPVRLYRLDILYVVLNLLSYSVRLNGHKALGCFVFPKAPLYYLNLQ